MIRKSSMLVIGCIFLVVLFGCSDKKEQEIKEVAVAESSSKSEDVKNSDENQDEAQGKGESLTLPDGFPADFPLPKNITITEVDDDSNEDRYSFGIRFNFDPNIDMDATFQMYDEYANRLEYNIIIGGEEYFADGVFQFGATSKMSASDMFVVTLKPDGATFGDIQLKVSK